jgi:RNA polymerase sigma-70 factor, ECF subfamily
LHYLQKKIHGAPGENPPLEQWWTRIALSYRTLQFSHPSMDLSADAVGFSRCPNTLLWHDETISAACVSAGIARFSLMIGATLDEPGVAPVPDEVLMKDISHRRHDALAELYGRHSKRLRATIDGVVHEEAEADDVLQEIFLQVWEEAGRYSPKAGKPLGWMVTIARRRAIDRLRRRQAYSRARERYEKRVVQDSQTPRRDAAESFVRNDLRQFLKKNIRALPQFQREAVELAFFNGLSHREIAAATNSPLGTVKTRLELGLQKLTHTLKPLRHKV